MTNHLIPRDGGKNFLRVEEKLKISPFSFHHPHKIVPFCPIIKIHWCSSDDPPLECVITAFRNLLPLGWTLTRITSWLCKCVKVQLADWLSCSTEFISHEAWFMWTVNTLVTIKPVRLCSKRSPRWQPRVYLIPTTQGIWRSPIMCPTTRMLLNC